ncbi:hypothetical protein O3P69_012435 [Scylla paramamosain]|uniref:Uncharacterized protein n=1 Tax=Scylla paramamosain TaxID=85552 RepID=A0AAW0SJK8_SCYPA
MGAKQGGLLLLRLAFRRGACTHAAPARHPSFGPVRTHIRSRSPSDRPSRRSAYPPTPVAATHSNAASRRAPLLLSSPLVRRCETGTGFVKGVVKAAASKGPSKAPIKAPVRLASLPVPLCRLLVEKPARRGRASSGIHPQGSRKRSCCGVWHADATVGSKRPDVPVRVGIRGGGDFSPLAPLAESSDRRVSGPSVERARLRGRGSSGSLYRRSSL